jgi:TetR/AcrR family transcriptional repressor of nem operon
MRYEDGHKEAVRARIVEAASHALRRDGLAGISIPALMKTVGLTHGGFYVHFRSRDELVAAAVLSAAEETASRALSDDLGGIDAVLRAYLSKEHVDRPSDGCVLAALGGEGRRQRAPVRRAFAKAARGLLEHLQRKLHPGPPDGHLADDTLAIAARMVGAVVLARLVDDPRIGGQILTAARDA